LRKAEHAPIAAGDPETCRHSEILHVSRIEERRNTRSGAATTACLAIQIADHIGGSGAA
jgi:hypothetical protein